MLAALRRAGDPYELSPGALLTQTLVTSGTMTNRIDRLEGKGLVARLPDPHDRRGVLVRLTAEGRAASTPRSPTCSTRSARSSPRSSDDPTAAAAAPTPAAHACVAPASTTPSIIAVERRRRLRSSRGVDSASLGGCQPVVLRAARFSSRQGAELRVELADLLVVGGVRRPSARAARLLARPRACSSRRSMPRELLARVPQLRRARRRRRRAA